MTKKNVFEGDSSSKKRLRLRLWAEVASILGMRRFSGKHLVTAQCGGADVGCLIGLGAAPANIIVVDEDAEAAMRVLEKYERFGVKVVCGNLLKVAREHHRDIVSAHLDYGKPLSVAMINTAKSFIAHAMQDMGFIGVSIRCGNEEAPLQKEIDDTMSLSEEALLGEDKDDLARTSNTIAAARIGVLQARLFDVPMRVGVRIMHAINYEEEGAVYATMLAHVIRATPGAKARQFAETFARKSNELGMPNGHNTTCNEQEFKEWAVDHRETKDGLLFHAECFSVDEETLDNWTEEVEQ